MLGNIAAIGVAVIWGLSFVAAKVVLSTLTPIMLATVRFSIASLVFTPIIVKESKRGNVPTPRELLKFAALGFISISIYFVLQYTGVKYAGAGISALLVVGLIPIFTGLTSTFILGEKYGVSKVLGTLLGFLGVGLIALPGFLLNNVDWLFYVGVACLLLNALCWALYSVLSRRLIQQRGGPLLIASYVTILGTLLLLPMSVTSDWGSVRYLHLEDWVSITYLALACSCVGYFLWNFSLQKLEAIRAAVWLYLEPVVAFIGEALLFGSLPSSTTIIGGTAIIVGALLTNLPTKLEKTTN
ncbi:MAG: DMT family transporter [archaeon]